MKYIKNYTKPILFFTIGILLFSLIQSGSLTSMMYKIQANLLQGLNLVKITEEKSEINDEELTIRFKVPSIHYEDKQVERNINNYIRRNIKEYVNVQRQVNKINRYSQKHSINVSYSVVFEDENMINILIEKNTTWGKNDYKMEKDSYVFNLKNGERIYLDEFLKDNKDYSRVITDIIQSKISKNHPLYNNLNIDKNTNYYIQDRYINIYFNPYKQSGDNTPYEFKIPYDAFKNKIEASSNFFLVNTIKSELLTKNNKYLKSKLEIPVITGDNKEISDKVNKKIKDDILNYYKQSLKEAEDFQQDFDTENSNFVADASYEIKKNTDNFISLNIYHYKYSGGAHGDYEYIPYNIDMRKGNFLTLKDLFKDNYDYKSKINNEINSQIKELEKKQNAEGVYDFTGIHDNVKYYVDRDNLVFFFDLYEIAPYAAGIPEFSINIDKFNNNIKDEYKFILQ